MQILPADPAAVALAGTVAGDAVTSALEAAELLDVDVDDLAGVFAFIATDRLGRLQGLQGVWLGNERGLEERSRKPLTLCVLKRATHFPTVLGVVLKRRAAAAWLSPPSITARTICSRPFGVRRAFLWVSIRSSANRWGLATSAFPVAIEWTTS